MTPARTPLPHFRRLIQLSILAAMLGALPAIGWALGGERFVRFDPAPGAAPLVTAGAAAPLFVDAADWPGVQRATRDLQADVARVASVSPVINPEAAVTRPFAVIVGTVGRSALIDVLVKAGKLDTAPIAGRWEAFMLQTVEQPLPGVERALVIAGSDKRGTIYGIYELSEQIGVSPWYWWADVPVVHRDAIFVPPLNRVDAGPAVKYRGIFLNDEAPALSGWAQEKFGGINSTMYAHVFELILRLRANYLWPAMWNNAFNEDDPESPRLADDYGVVMGTSHHEPMLRAQQEWARHGSGPWDYAKNGKVLREFWADGVRRNRGYESIVTLAMRGDGDEPMSEDANVALLEKIVADQRAILAKEVNPDVTKVPQLWALYKEVQEYYERGMRVPDDVTLLWCDDNWGNIRRLPTAAERKRSGGAGVYYHFDYVGGPRNYKWLNTVPITKVWEQMHLAWQHEATRIWIVNVGDLKPMEFPIEFFLTYAWDPSRLPYERLGEFSERWAAREFGSEHAAEIAALVNGYTKLNGRRKPEMITPDTLSLVNYGEAERVLGEWSDLVARAETVEATLPEAARDAFFQLVLYPVKASANLQELYVAAGRNRLYALQGRVSANLEAKRVRQLFDADAALVKRFHTLNGGKWNHQMDQAKFGYMMWQQPPAEVMPAVALVRPNKGAVAALAVEGSETGWPVWGAPRPTLPPIDVFGRPPRWVELFNRGDAAYSFTATPDQPWLRIEPATGEVKDTTRLAVSVDWATAPEGNTTAKIALHTTGGANFTVAVPIVNPVELRPGAFAGFVEVDNHVAIEAPHFARAVGDREAAWSVLPDFGRALGGVTIFPVHAAERTPGGSSPRLEYDLHFFSAGEAKVELTVAPSLDFHPENPLRIAVSFDDQKPQILRIATNPNTWEPWGTAVGEGVRRVTSSHPLGQAGRHTLKVWAVTPGVVLERIVIDTGTGKAPGVRPSYLGPDESPRGGN
ncbi:MAG: glycosyl hydrolase 115 family protein [Opitutaceae bacterium]